MGGRGIFNYIGESVRLGLATKEEEMVYYYTYARLEDYYNKQKILGDNVSIKVLQMMFNLTKVEKKTYDRIAEELNVCTKTLYNLRKKITFFADELIKNMYGDFYKKISIKGGYQMK